MTRKGRTTVTMTLRPDEPMVATVNHRDRHDVLRPNTSKPTLIGRITAFRRSK
ncbi:hypothetical protein HSBGL_0886 [Halapricum desulfuricans]|uniref:Uncharacterized protein n=1 Tax=Halapricum desulfuricans TaxID=2841257 RepID=A0A897NM76_9EURY|nr:hypothetical protein HSBGL_0886 [Halapricum desulfuricans]